MGAAAPVGAFGMLLMVFKAMQVSRGNPSMSFLVMMLPPNPSTSQSELLPELCTTSAASTLPGAARAFLRIAGCDDWKAAAEQQLEGDANR